MPSSANRRGRWDHEQISARGAGGGCGADRGLVMEIVMRGYVTGEYRHCITARGATIAEVDADAERQRWALGI